METNNFMQLPSLPSRAFNYRLQAELEDLSEGPQELAVLGIEEKKGICTIPPSFGVQGEDAGTPPPPSPASLPFQSPAPWIKQPKIHTDVGVWAKISPLHCPAKPPHRGMKQRGGPQGPQFFLTSTCSCLASRNGPNCEETVKKIRENHKRGEPRACHQPQEPS